MITVQKVISAIRKAGLSYRPADAISGQGFRAHSFDREISVAYAFGRNTSWAQAIDDVVKCGNALQAAGMEVGTMYRERDINLYVTVNTSRKYDGLCEPFEEKRFREYFVEAIAHDKASRKKHEEEEAAKLAARKQRYEASVALMKSLNPSPIPSQKLQAFGMVDNGIELFVLKTGKAVVYALVRQKPSTMTDLTAERWVEVPCLELDIMYMVDGVSNFFGDGRCTIREVVNVEEGIYRFLAEYMDR